MEPCTIRSGGGGLGPRHGQLGRAGFGRLQGLRQAGLGSIQERRQVQLGAGQALQRVGAHQALQRGLGRTTLLLGHGPHGVDLGVLHGQHGVHELAHAVQLAKAGPARGDAGHLLGGLAHLVQRGREDLGRGQAVVGLQCGLELLALGQVGARAHGLGLMAGHAALGPGAAGEGQLLGQGPLALHIPVHIRALGVHAHQLHRQLGRHPGIGRHGHGIGHAGVVTG
jgi:hypothetical protein